MKVLFVCNGNVARSQEAETFFTSLVSERHCAMSAGVDVRVGKPLDPLVLTVMREVGYRMDNAERKMITESMVFDADMVVSFKPIAELPPFSLAIRDFRYWPVADPRGQSLRFHRDVRDQIRELVQDLVHEFELV